jgi:hypothetical protein
VLFGETDSLFDFDPAFRTEAVVSSKLGVTTLAGKLQAGFQVLDNNCPFGKINIFYGNAEGFGNPAGAVKQ